MTDWRLLVNGFGSWWQGIDTQSFKTIFISIILEAFPFLMLGVLISSLLQVLVSEERLKRIIPKNPAIGLLVASGLGIFFPVCECGMIPVARRLIQKGMPAYLGITYMLAAPVVNPVVYFATYSAFQTKPEMVYGRMGLAYAVAVTAGLLIYLLVKGNPLKIKAQELRGEGVQEQKKMTLSGWVEHMLNDFFDMTKYLLFGAFVAACLQVLVARSTLIDIGAHSWSSYPFMMGLAYVLSLCSTSDAFVAASFNGSFSQGPLLAFLVLGPMLDFKSTLMMFSAFRFRFVLLLIVILIVLVWSGSVLATLIPWRYLI
ncbi:MAG: permease [Paenibacillaceae bacterium]|nr:permease [Paenibacillaceae bacterium]